HEARRGGKKSTPTKEQLSPAEASSLEDASSSGKRHTTTSSPEASTTAEQEAGSYSPSPRRHNVPENQEGENY
ncbi:hypothetical protein A2U01_0072200, partial [Trifolium medium]|nr:hypothetical protein [Trifolium medium]